MKLVEKVHTAAEIYKPVSKMAVDVGQIVATAKNTKCTACGHGFREHTHVYTDNGYRVYSCTCGNECQLCLPG